MKNFVALFICFYICSVDSPAQNQGINNIWLFGYGHQWGAPWGATNIDFNSGNPIISTTTRGMSFARTAANISDVFGNILIYTNGYYIADASNDTLMNSSGFNPTTFPQSSPSTDPNIVRLNVPQACLIIKKPGNNSIYYLFHNTLDNPPAYNHSHYLYLTTIDMNINGGLGAAVLKNHVLISDTLNAGKITACKHANGRDWWVVCQRVNSNKIYSFLVTPNSIDGPFFQNIGAVRPTASGQVAFSPDGTKFAYYYLSGGLEVMDFDRCTGIFSNPVFISTGNFNFFGGGVGFSPSGQFVYIGDIYYVFQYDVTATNILATEIKVAEWDSFYSPQPPFATLFEMMQLAPDGKIYISTGNGTFHMHVINNPDSAGLACDIAQHSIQLPYYYSNGIPNHPNYFLGALAGSPCDTLTGVGFDEPPGIVLKVFPNPSNGVFTLSFPVQSESGVLEVYDVNGKLVHREHVAAWSQFKRVELTPLSKGIYFCRLRWGSAEGNVKILIE